MSEASVSSPSFTAIGVVTLGDEKMASRPFAFDMSGAHMILQRVPGLDEFEVVQANKHKPGTARFEKTITQPVTFLVSRDDKPYWRVEVKGMFDSMVLDLITD